eukprot:4159014-Amphidinium_carterae.1
MHACGGGACIPPQRSSVNVGLTHNSIAVSRQGQYDLHKLLKVSVGSAALSAATAGCRTLSNFFAGPSLTIQKPTVPTPSLWQVKLRQSHEPRQPGRAKEATGKLLK